MKRLNWKQQVALIKKEQKDELYQEDLPQGLQVVREATEEELLELKAHRRAYWAKKAEKPLTSNPFKELLKKAA